jgi:acyl carrier protein
MTTLQRVQECINESAGVTLEDITPESHLYDDLGLDSLDAAELMMDLEAEFDTDIPDSVAEDFRTVQDIVSYLREVGV